MKVLKIKPLFDGVITTMDVYSESDFEVLSFSDVNPGTIKEYQTVIAVSKQAESQGLAIGDKVAINPNRYMKVKHKDSLRDEIMNDSREVTYELPIIELNDTQVLNLRVGDINYIIEEFEA